MTDSCGSLIVTPPGSLHVPDDSSVDRDGQRAEAEIINVIKSKFELKAIVKLQTSFCRKIGTKVLAKPLDKNMYHAEIHDLGKVALTASKAKKLARACEIVALENN